MGEKIATRPVTASVRRAVLGTLKALPASAKVADLIAAVNAIILALDPRSTPAATLPAGIAEKVAAAKQQHGGKPATPPA